MSKIPRIRPPGSITSGQNWNGSTIGNGKGDTPRNISDRYRDEHDRILGPAKKTGHAHVRIVYRDGKRIELPTH